VIYVGFGDSLVFGGEYYFDKEGAAQVFLELGKLLLAFVERGEGGAILRAFRKEKLVDAVVSVLQARMEWIPCSLRPVVRYLPSNHPDNGGCLYLELFDALRQKVHSAYLTLTPYQGELLLRGEGC
jgi:hypothetical protein